MITRRTFGFVVISLGGAVAAPIPGDAQRNDTVPIRMRVDDSVRGKIPTVLQRTLTIQPDESEEAKELIRRSPASRAVPIMAIVVGAIAVTFVLQLIREMLRQTYYGGVIIDVRTKPVSVTNEWKVPANMVFVIDADGKTSQFKSDQLSPELLGKILGGK